MKRGAPMLDKAIVVGACADYILGLPMKIIKDKWKVSHTSVSKYVNASGHFKRRPNGRKAASC